MVRISLPNPYFAAFEMLMWALFLTCWRTAREEGAYALWELISGALFGLLLEAATIWQLHAYHYGRFGVMFGDVPLAIGMGWGVIICSVRRVKVRGKVPGWLRPVLAGLLALNIDLSMDAIAIRLGMWHWGMPLNKDFFGVPYANFWAWFWVVFSFSLSLDLLRKWKLDSVSPAAPLAAVPMGLVGVLFTNELIVNIVPRPFAKPVIFLTLGTAFLLVLAYRLRIDPRGGLRGVAAVVPLSFHLYFLAAGTISGVIFRPVWLLVVSLLMFLVSLLIHFDVRSSRLVQWQALRKSR